MSVPFHFLFVFYGDYWSHTQHCSGITHGFVLKITLGGTGDPVELGMGPRLAVWGQVHCLVLVLHPLWLQSS